MNLHANAALSRTGGRQLCEFVVEEGWTVVASAESAGVDEAIVKLRRLRFTATEIAETLRSALLAVSGTHSPWGWAVGRRGLEQPVR
jgi:hypothetical protein